MYSLPYGKGAISLPDLWSGEAAVLAPGPFPDTDPEKTVIHALENPKGGVRLEELCRPGDRVTCVVPDLTRRAAVRQYLPVLLRKLEELGLSRDHVTIIIALGIHRPLTGTEIERLVGSSVKDRYRVINHDAEGKGSNVLLGTTDSGIPVQINRCVAEADCVILTGGISYHYFAGYGGGRKSLLPGVASREACEAHHRMVVSWRHGQLDGELAPGALRGNPAHEQMVQACRFIPRIFILNVVTEPGGRIVEASSGELEAAHEDICTRHDRWFRKDLEAPSALVIASAGGHPKDVNFVQAHKGLFTAHRAAAKHGVVILAAECPEGPGHRDLLDWFDRCRTEREWLNNLEASYQINGQTAFSTWLRVRSVPTVLMSSLPAAEVEKMGMRAARDIREALKAAEEILGGLPAPLIIPDAGDILPVVKCEG